jgi:hypothetical protein
MSEPKQEKQSKKSGGGKQQSTKKEGAAKRGRNKNPEGRMHTLKNAERHKATEARNAQALLTRLLARGGDGKPGGIKLGSVRHYRLAAHIESLSKGLPVGQQKAETHRTRLVKAGNAVGRKLIGLVESGALKAGNESRPMLQYALSIFAKAKDSGQATKLTLRYGEACEKRAKAEGAGTEPATHEKRNFQVPKKLGAPKLDRKAAKAKQRSRLIREAKNFVAMFANKTKGLVDELDRKVMVLDKTETEDKEELQELKAKKAALQDEKTARESTLTHVRELMAQRVADLTLRFVN